MTGGGGATGGGASGGATGGGPTGGGATGGGATGGGATGGGGGSATGGGSAAGGGSGTNWTATFGPCTRGMNCFCDRIKTTGTLHGPYTNVFFCEDWDHDALWLDTPTMPGGYGNWAAGDTSDYPPNFNRGRLSYWRIVYGREGSLIPNGEPAAPVVGQPCGIGFPCDQAREWRADNRYLASASNLGALIDVIRPGEFDDELTNAVTPLIDGSGSASVFGNALMASRNPSGAGNTGGTYGSTYGAPASNTADFNGTRSQLGITAAVGYSDNLLASGILATNWKHDEFKPTQQGDVQDGLFGFRNSNSGLSTFPFHFPVTTGSTGYPDCADGTPAGTMLVGQKACQGTFSLVLRASSADYDFTRDFALGKLHCMSVYWDFRVINDVTMKAWLDGRLVVHATGLDFTGSQVDAPSGPDGYNAFAFNNYANANAGQGSAPTTQVVRRYNDNYVMREGTPVLCEDLGFPAAFHQSGL